MAGRKENGDKNLKRGNSFKITPFAPLFTPLPAPIPGKGKRQAVAALSSKGKDRRIARPIWQNSALP